MSRWPLIKLPPDTAALMDEVAAIDREYFEKRPHLEAAVRDYIPGEFNAGELCVNPLSPPTRTVVVRVHGDVRLRSPVWPEHDVDATARHLLEIADQLRLKRWAKAVHA